MIAAATAFRAEAQLRRDQLNTIEDNSRSLPFDRDTLFEAKSRLREKIVGLDGSAKRLEDLLEQGLSHGKE